MSERIFKGTPFNKSVVWRKFSVGDDSEVGFKTIPVLQGGNKVIRRFPLYQYFGEDPQREVLIAQKVFKEFGSYANLNVPNFDIVRGVLGEDDILKSYLFVVDLIKGKNLAVKNFSAGEQGQATEVLSGFLESFIDYAKDKYTKGGLYVKDQAYHQYVYGKAPGETENKVYFVDLHPLLGVFDVDHSGVQSNEVFFNSVIGFIGDFIKLTESKLQSGHLTSVREQYVDFLNTILIDSHPFAYKVQLFKDVLEDRKN